MAQPERKVYVVWTNKGGVGKTTLSFHIATTFAETRRAAGWKVLVCDLCPQANISMTLLTESKGPPESSKAKRAKRSSGADQDEEADREGSQVVHELCHRRLHPEMEIYQTVAGYIQSFVSRKAEAKVDEDRFVVRPCEYNSAIPDNLYLLCGDTALDVSCERLDQYRRMDPGGDGEEPWKEGTLSLREFVRKACDRIDSEAKWMVIIDTNPALTTYTQIALVAADYLIMPVNADDFSNVAVKALFNLLYGATVEEEPRFTAIRKLTFAYKAQESGVPLPRVHMVVNNRQTMYRLRASEAFFQMGDNITTTLFQLFTRYCERFTDGESVFEHLHDPDRGMHELARYERFGKLYTDDLKDFHTTAVACTHTGKPLSHLSRQLTINKHAEKTVKISADSLKGCKKSVDKLLAHLLQ